MIPDYTPIPGQDHQLHLLRSEYLRRLARFALIDDIPSPWGPAARPEKVDPSTELEDD
jgi:hypothetical protein